MDRRGLPLRDLEKRDLLRDGLLTGRGNIEPENPQQARRDANPELIRAPAGKASAHPPVRRNFLTSQEAADTVHCGLRNRGERLTGKKSLV